MSTLPEDKNWYLRAPSLDYPDGGPIRIGNIITNVAEPQNDIANLDGQLKIIPGISYGKGQKDREIHSSAAIKLATKLYTAFGGQADAQRSKDWKTTYKFDRIDSVMLARNPRVEQVQELRSTNKAVRDALTKGPIYIISSLKLANGLKYANEHMRDKEAGMGGQAHVTQEATFEGDVKGSKSGKTSETYNMMGNVILAYKLQIVKTKGWKWKGEVDLSTGTYDPGRAGFMSKEGELLEEPLECDLLSPRDIGFIAREEEYESVQDHEMENEEDDWWMTCIEA
ncbi:hypothetical protein J4E83_004791 [Alternaria metachromatica]|uniref:uncharacterized protein n=1 Tax=Alternaria metachromatica TaxID=283354 RepID=UPI0020C406A0|nr:uncharacterized protein J4E83_004791 [Alternaria metachromatica]KAI4623397.1 hypothetical protein J4E83_004791 [Alternaria metachromatica]